MRNIFFYPSSRAIDPHYDEHGTLHLPMSEWDNVLRHESSGYPYSLVDRDVIPEYPTQQGAQHGN